jgi:hypothetical protein
MISQIAQDDADAKINCHPYWHGINPFDNCGRVRKSIVYPHFHSAHYPRRQLINREKTDGKRFKSL